MHVRDEDSGDATSFQGRLAELMLSCFAAVKHVQIAGSSAQYK